MFDNSIGGLNFATFDKPWQYPLYSGITTYRNEVLITFRRFVLIKNQPAQIILVILLAMVLIGFLNYQFEASFRMAFFGGLRAKKDTAKMKVCIQGGPE